MTIVLRNPLFKNIFILISSPRDNRIVITPVFISGRLQERGTEWFPQDQSGI